MRCVPRRVMWCGHPHWAVGPISRSRWAPYETEIETPLGTDEKTCQRQTATHGAPASGMKRSTALGLGGGAILIVLVGAGVGYLAQLRDAFCSEGSCKSHVNVTTTWTWDGAKWTAEGKASAVGGTKVGAHERLAFDAGHEQLVLVAESFTTSPLSYTKTWTWSAGGWRATRASTSDDFVGTMAYDAQERQPLMFASKAVYRWSGSDWQNLGPAGGPGTTSLRLDQLVYYPPLSSVLTVNETCFDTRETNTFVFRGNSWLPLPQATLPSWGT